MAGLPHGSCEAAEVPGRPPKVKYPNILIEATLFVFSDIGRIGVTNLLYLIRFICG